jgi:hypothetical protein
MKHLGCANAVAAPGAFVDVAAEQIGRLDALDPLAQNAAASMPASTDRVEQRAVRQEVDNEMERLASCSSASLQPLSPRPKVDKSPAEM